MPDAPADTLPQAAPPAKPFPRWLQLLPVALWAVLGWVLLTELPRNLAAPPVVDLSWRGVLTYASEQGRQWGKDVVFTYGPLGYVHHPVFTEGSWWKSILYQGARSAVYLALLWQVAAGLRRREVRWVLCIVGVLLPSIDPDAIHMLMIWFMGVLFCRAAPGDRRVAWLGLAAAVFGAHIKMTFLLHAVAVLALSSAQMATARRWKEALLPPALFAAAFLLTWIFPAGQSLANLPAHLKYGLVLASGYSEAMGLAAPEGILPLGFLCAAFTTILLLAPRLGDWRVNWGLALLTLATLYLAWKQAFVRGDFSHTRILFAILLTMLAYAFGEMTWPPRGERYRPYAIGALAMTLVLGAISRQFQVSGIVRDLFTEKLQWAAFGVLFPGKVAETYARLASRYELPEIKRVVGSGSVDVIGLQESTAIMNGLNYRPAPVFQGYVAYSRPLLELNTRYYQSAEAPDFVLYRITRIDKRMMASDNAPVLLEILRNYTPVLRERGFILYRRSPRGPVKKTLIAEGTIEAGQPPQILPSTGKPLWCELEIRETLAGKLYKQVLYRPPVKFDFILPVSKDRFGFDMVPPVAREGFFAAPVLASDPAVISLADPAVQTSPLVLGCYLDESQRRLVQARIDYKLYEVNIQLDPAQDAETLAEIRRMAQAWAAEDAAKKPEDF